ncbi:MAG: DUF2157 domain-containing protein [Gammaproteobacteria bacterium]
MVGADEPEIQKGESGADQATDFMNSRRAHLIHWIETGAIPGERIDDALAVADILPTTRAWRHFIDRLLLFTGTLSLAAAVIFFFAYNWEAMGRYAKFGLVEGLIVLALIGYWKLGTERLPGKAMLLLATLLLGALLALFGQTYQTGADPWQLFANWALLMLPWAVVGRFAALWIVWVALLNVALFLYLSVFGGLFGVLFSEETQLFLVFGLNTAAWLAWELGARRFAWLNERWALRLLALASGTAVTLLVLQTIFDWSDASGTVSVVYPLWIMGVYWIYRHRIRDLFMLAGGCLSLIVVMTTLLARVLLEWHEMAGGYLFIALVVVGMSAAAALWLKRVQVEFES